MPSPSRGGRHTFVRAECPPVRAARGAGRTVEPRCTTVQRACCDEGLDDRLALGQQRVGAPGPAHVVLPARGRALEVDVLLDVPGGVDLDAAVDGGTHVRVAPDEPAAARRSRCRRRCPAAARRGGRRGRWRPRSGRRPASGRTRAATSRPSAVEADASGRPRAGSSARGRAAAGPGSSAAATGAMTAAPTATVRL